MKIKPLIQIRGGQKSKMQLRLNAKPMEDTKMEDTKKMNPYINECPYSIEYRIRITTKSGYNDSYFSAYADAQAFIIRSLKESGGSEVRVDMNVLLMGPVVFGKAKEVLADHYAFTLDAFGGNHVIS